MKVYLKLIIVLVISNTSFVFCLHQDTSQKKDSLLKIAKEFEKNGIYDSALTYKRQYNYLKDSLYQVEVESSNKNSGENLNQVKTEIYTTKKAIKSSSKRAIQTLDWIISYWYIVFILMLLIILFLIKIYKKIRLKTQLNQQQKLILKKYSSLEEAYSNIYFNLENLRQELNKQNATDNVQLPDWVVKLSKKEMEVLSYLSIGLVDKEISEKMSVSLSTTRTYCRRIYTKLMVKNRSEAVNFALRHGLI